MKSTLIDLTGKRFSNLLVVCQGERLRPKVPRWKCICDCGKTIVTDGKSLRRGLSKSCGCLKRQLFIDNTKTHGMTETSEYKTWCGIKRRCYNKNDTSYPRYGGRGISMSEEWKTSFQSFINDMGKKPDATYSIERIDPDGNYEPSNCKWLPLLEQNNNRRDTIKVTALGKTQLIREWEAETGIPYSTIQARLARGWTDIASVTTPVIINRRNKKCLPK